jgi:zinc/manganese transport system permease protein
MMLPAAAARFWSRTVWSMALMAVGVGFAAAYVGLLVSFHADLPSGPAIILTASAAYAVSLLVGSEGGLLRGGSRSRPAEA